MPLNPNKSGGLRRANDRLKAARAAAGYRTAKEFADTHGIETSTYSNHESGARGIRQPTADRYVDFLAPNLAGISADWIRFGDGPPPANIAKEPARNKGQLNSGRRGIGNPRAVADFPNQINPAAAAGPADGPGDDLPGPDVLNKEILARVVVSVETYLENHARRVPPGRKADLILCVYEAYVESGDWPAPIDPERFRHVIRLASESA